MPTETELKLVLAPEALRRVRRHALIQRLKQGRGVSKQLKSVYFDTEDLSLHRNHLVLRVRHIGLQRIQTLKNAAPTAAGLLDRQEWETEIEGDRPEAGPLDKASVDLPSPGNRLVRNLQPIFTTEVKRTTYRLGADGWEIELALDEGAVIGPKGSTPIAEAELELKKGRPRILFDIARDLQDETGARISVSSKSERGYALLAGAGPAPRRARPPLYPDDATIAQAFQSISRACAEQLLINQDVLFATQNPEAVHQMRVALRRLISGIRLFADFLETPETQMLREEMRWLQSFLAPARDAEVFISDILDPLAAEMGGERGFRALKADFTKRRKQTLEAAVKALAEPRFTTMALTMGAWIEGGDWQMAIDEEQRKRLASPAQDYAVAVLDRLDRRVRRALRGLEALPPEERHRARIRVKRLRYAIEFFSGLFPGYKTRRIVSMLGRIQDRLGQLNDIAVAGRLLRDHAEAKGDPQRLWAAGQIAGWHAGRVGELLVSAEDGRRALQRLKRFWRD
ncbi:MAG TPA: CHAD domain-containing protein [Magnetospirillaceae bacterium]